MTKRIWMLGTILLCLAGGLLAQAPALFLEVAPVAGDGWPGVRYQLAPEQPWPLSGAAWLAVSWNDQALNPEDPGAKFVYWFPATGQRYWVIAAPAVEWDDWHNVVQVFDADGEVLARSDDFTVHLGTGPRQYAYAAPAMSVGYGFTCSIQIINPSDFAIVPELEFWSFDAGLVEVWIPPEPVAAGSGISTFLDELIPGPFNGWVRVTAPVPVVVTGLTGRSLEAGWVMLPANPQQ